MRSFAVLSFFAVLGAVASASGPNEGYYMQPTIRGNTIVFVSQGDLWKVGANGGEATAITSHVAPASHPALSPDGKTVAFTGTYDGPREAYTLSMSGDVPQRITFEGDVAVDGWSPDGKVIASTAQHSGSPSIQVVLVDPKTRKETLAPLAEASDGVYDPTGKTLFFTRLPFQGSSTKRYQGGENQNIWKYTDGAAEAVPLTKDFAGTSKTPMWWNHRIYFLSDRDGVMNLWSMDGDGGSLKQLTHYTDWDIQSASMDDGKIVYQLGADLHLFDVASGQDKMLHITLASDFDQSREKPVDNPMAYLTSVHIAPDGSKIALTARGQVFVAPVEDGRFVEITRKPGVRYRNAMFTSDGKSVLVLSDQTGETEWWKYPANGVGVPEQISHGAKVLVNGGAVSPDGKMLAYEDKNQVLWVYDFGTNKSTQVVACKDGDPTDFRWSPDSRWLAYTLPTFTFNRVMVYSVKDNKSTAVTTDRSDSENPAWSPDGKWLYFVSERTFHSLVGAPWGSRQPEPYFDKQSKIYLVSLQKGLRSPFQEGDELYKEPDAKKPDAKKTDKVQVDIDFDGIIDRAQEAPIPAGNYSDLYAAEGRIFARSSTVGAGSNLIVVDVKNEDVSPKVLVPAVGGFELSADGKKLLIQKGGHFYSVNAADNVSLDKPVDLSGWTFFIEPREEWRQIFTEAWRLHRDYFYDPNMHGVDWNAQLAKYQPLVDRVRDRSELNNVLSQLVGELSTLHTFVVGGDTRGTTGHVQDASLGASLVRDESGGGYRVNRLYHADPDYPESTPPLLKPGVDMGVGDVIISINGVSTLSVPNIAMLLRNKAGKQVLLHVKSSGKERDCIVTPMSEGAFNDLRYTDWELSRRHEVETASNGKIGYVHLRAMGAGDIATWERDFYPVFDRQGLIIDVRNNGGGNVDSWILERLLRKAWHYFQPRVGEASWNMMWAFRGHVVVICNAGTASDGEDFTEGIKRLNIGKVIGTRTWGGEVWLSFDNTLVDNGIASAAELGLYGPEGKWLIEGHGVDPDIVVDNLPHATFLGKDAQLEAAIDYLSKEIKDHPVPPTPTPKYPDKSFHPKKSG